MEGIAGVPVAFNQTQTRFLALSFERDHHVSRQRTPSVVARLAKPGTLTVYSPSTHRPSIHLTPLAIQMG